MRFQVQRRRSIAAAIIAVGDDQLRRVAVGWSATSAAAIHRTRVAIKRVRALLALCGSGAAGETLDRRLRDLGRQLAAPREVTALDECWKDVVQRAPEKRAVDVAQIDQEFRERLHRPMPVPLAGLVSDLTAARASWNRLPLRDGDPEDLITHLSEEYRRCRRTFHRLEVDSPAAAFHRLRKRAKRLQYQLEFCGVMAPERWGELHEHLQLLTDIAGRHHDLVILAERLQQHLAASPARHRVLRLIDARQTQLARKILRRGQPAFAEKPGRF